MHYSTLKVTIPTTLADRLDRLAALAGMSGEDMLQAILTLRLHADGWLDDEMASPTIKAVKSITFTSVKPGEGESVLTPIRALAKAFPGLMLIDAKHIVDDLRVRKGPMTLTSTEPITPQVQDDLAKSFVFHV